MNLSNISDSRLTHWVGGATEPDGAQRTDQAPSGSDYLVLCGVPPGEARLEQYGEVANFVGYLVHQYGECRKAAYPPGHQKGASQGQAVGEVVHAVGE